MSDDGRAPRTIGGRYQVLGTLGHGGMATVYRAVDEQLGREVAVKVFRTGPVDHGERSRAEAEIRVLASLRHPSLVTLYDAAIADGDGESFLVMELVPGTDLATRMRDGALPRGVVAHIGAQVADALAAVHAQGIVHRDVKPANVLIEDDATAPGGLRVKLADFGIALLRDAARLTGTGMVMGTAAYLAPEQVTNQELTGEADVYALGLLLLEALTGRQAFPGGVMESATARLTRAPEIDPSLPVAWRTLLHTMSAMAPEDRPTAAEVAARLRALGRDVDTAAAPTALLDRPGGPGRAAAAAGAAAGVAGAAVGAMGADAAHADRPTAAMDAPTRAMPTGDAPTRLLTSTQGGGADAPTAVLGGGVAGADGGGGGGARAGGAGGRGAGSGGRGAGSGGGGAGPDGPGPSGSGAERARRRRTAWIVVAVVAALVVIGVLVALAVRSRGPATPEPTGTATTMTSGPVTSPLPSQAPSSGPSEPAQPTQPAQTAEPAPQPSVTPTTVPQPEPTVPVATPTTAAGTVKQHPGKGVGNVVEDAADGHGNGHGNATGNGKR
ncbi:serine/threonine protein kinase [Curtobacterium sp. MCBD17_013]|uniref:serine/threonine-protein kinase n=1 Tax=Curtobacterium sp. MCBD17_013 TaxID=2175668 RepID=UPI000DAA55C1|nr:serine/threonine-protein kinase [Curtobacterium sp. MCBD17_013]PZF61717.1 serine/threonine protein kinase [Curtobacterium sp. MCBD17_013]